MPCPSAEDLAALYDCTLPRELADRLRTHVAGCPRCAADVSSLTRLLDCPEPGEGMSLAHLDRAKQLAALAGDPQTPEQHRSAADAPGGLSPTKPISTGK